VVEISANAKLSPEFLHTLNDPNRPHIHVRVCVPRLPEENSKIFFSRAWTLGKLLRNQRADEARPRQVLWERRCNSAICGYYIEQEDKQLKNSVYMTFHFQYTGFTNLCSLLQRSFLDPIDDLVGNEARTLVAVVLQEMN
jgi:hypothetical protein